MNNNIENIIFTSVKKILKNLSSQEKIEKFKNIHSKKIHFIPEKYRMFNGLLQSLNIQFGNFIEELMFTLISKNSKYKIVDSISQNKNNKFQISKYNNNLIDQYIIKCQENEIENLDIDFDSLLKEIFKHKDEEPIYEIKHDVDLLFKDEENNKFYYLEIKYNDDYDSGKYVDINRKFIKTYAYLLNKLKIDKYDSLIPIIFYFTNKKLKGNIYVPEKTNIKRGKHFFNEFLNIEYKDIETYMTTLSENENIIKLFDNLYNHIVKDIKILDEENIIK